MSFVPLERRVINDGILTKNQSDERETTVRKVCFDKSLIELKRLVLQLLTSENILLFSIRYHYKQNTFWFWAVGRTKQDT